MVGGTSPVGIPFVQRKAPDAPLPPKLPASPRMSHCAELCVEHPRRCRWLPCEQEEMGSMAVDFASLPSLSSWVVGSSHNYIVNLHWAQLYEPIENLLDHERSLWHENPSCRGKTPHRPGTGESAGCLFAWRNAEADHGSGGAVLPAGLVPPNPGTQLHRWWMLVMVIPSQVENHAKSSGLYWNIKILSHESKPYNVSYEMK